MVEFIMLNNIVSILYNKQNQLIRLKYKKSILYENQNYNICFVTITLTSKWL
jgi:hypothetical protein